MKNQNKWTIRLSLITPILLFVVVISMGGGHGTFIPAMTLFPLGMIGAFWQDNLTLPFIILAVFQYPLYGLIIDKALQKHQARSTVVGLIPIHIILAGLLIFFKDGNWK